MNLRIRHLFCALLVVAWPALVLAQTASDSAAPANPPTEPVDTVTAAKELQEARQAYNKALQEWQALARQADAGGLSNMGGDVLNQISDLARQAQEAAKAGRYADAAQQLADACKRLKTLATATQKDLDKAKAEYLDAFAKADRARVPKVGGEEYKAIQKMVQDADNAFRRKQIGLATELLDQASASLTALQNRFERDLEKARKEWENTILKVDQKLLDRYSSLDEYQATKEEHSGAFDLMEKGATAEALGWMLESLTDLKQTWAMARTLRYNAEAEPLLKTAHEAIIAGNPQSVADLIPKLEQMVPLNIRLRYLKYKITGKAPEGSMFLEWDNGRGFMEFVKIPAGEYMMGSANGYVREYAGDDRVFKGGDWSKIPDGPPPNPYPDMFPKPEPIPHSRIDPRPRATLDYLNTPSSQAQGVAPNLEMDRAMMKSADRTFPTFVYIAPGIRAKVRWEEPVHKVVIPEGFYIARFQVTQAQWRSVMGEGDTPWNTAQNEITHVLPVAGGKIWSIKATTKAASVNGPDVPASSFTYLSAYNFLHQLESKFEKNGVATVRLRMPTEEEWEYACRAGTTTRYSFGNDVGLLARYAWLKLNADKATHPVREKGPNPWGLFDMHGNVAEWCNDFYAESYPAAGAEDPRGPASGKDRVLRGGSWSSNADACRAPARAGEAPGFADVCFGYEAYGFRCMRRGP